MHSLQRLLRIFYNLCKKYFNKVVYKSNDFAYNSVAGRNTLYTRVIEFAFKRHVLSSTTGPPFGRFFFLGCETTNIYIYSDESGVFDKEHNLFFVFGGVIFLSRSEREANERKYLHAEREIRKSENIPSGTEVKATSISNKGKGKLFRSLNNVHKFGIIVRQSRLNDQIFAHKKIKQRYLDWAFKIAVKRKFEALIAEGLINPDEVENLYFYADEHSTATNGEYEIHETLEEEFKYGMFNRTWLRHYPPLFPNLKSVEFSFCNSSTKTLVRAADIVANKLYFCATKGIVRSIQSSNFHITYHPRLR